MQIFFCQPQRKKKTTPPFTLKLQMSSDEQPSKKAKTELEDLFGSDSSDDSDDAAGGQHGAASVAASVAADDTDALDKLPTGAIPRVPLCCDLKVCRPTK